MKSPLQLTALILAATALGSCQSSERAATWVDYGDNPMENPQFWEDMETYGAPGDHHERMSQYTGTWNVVGKFWMTPEGPPMETTGRSTIRSILGGRYILEEYSSEFEGEPYHGMLIQGYDNYKEEYFTIWMDNYSTRPMISTGDRDENGVLQTSTIHYDLLTPAGRPLRSEISEYGPDKMVMSMFDVNKEGVEFKSMEMSYTR